MDDKQSYAANIFVSDSVLRTLYHRRHNSDRDLNDTIARILGIRTVRFDVDELLILPRLREALSEAGYVTKTALLSPNMAWLKLFGVGPQGWVEILEAIKKQWPDEFPPRLQEKLEQHLAKRKEL